MSDSSTWQQPFPLAHRMAENFRRAVDLTAACLALRAATLSSQTGGDEPMKTVMHEIRLAKEQAWRQSPR